MKRAFTLIELLVAIPITAILAAVLFPVFAQAKISAKAAADISNHKQITLAVLMYAGDFDGPGNCSNAQAREIWKCVIQHTARGRNRQPALVAI